MTAFDETYSEIVHARGSYVASEIEWEARFTDIFREDDQGVLGIDLRPIHETESIRSG